VQHHVPLLVDSSFSQLIFLGRHLGVGLELESLVWGLQSYLSLNIRLTVDWTLPQAAITLSLSLSLTSSDLLFSLWFLV